MSIQQIVEGQHHTWPKRQKIQHFSKNIKKNTKLSHFFAKTLAPFKKKQYLCTAIQRKSHP